MEDDLYQISVPEYRGVAKASARYYSERSSRWNVKEIIESSKVIMITAERSTSRVATNLHLAACLECTNEV